MKDGADFAKTPGRVSPSWLYLLDISLWQLEARKGLPAWEDILAGPWHLLSLGSGWREQREEGPAH